MSDAVEPPGAKSATLLSPAQYAAHLGVKRQSVNYAIAKGRLTAASLTFDTQRKRWKIDPEIADREWHANTRQRSGVGVASKDDTEGAAPSNDLVLPDSDGSLGIGLQDLPRDEDGKPLPPMMVAAIKTSLEARIKQLELDKLRRSLVPADAAERTLEDVGRHLRDTILSAPSRIAKQLVGLTDAVQVEIILERALTEALGELVKSQEQAA
jgi:hypothetical protein